MCSINTHPPNTLLPSPPAVAHWPCGERASFSSKPLAHTISYPKVPYPEESRARPARGHTYVFGGLKTPPTDDMSATCHQLPLGAYDGPHDLAGFPTTVPQGGHQTHRHRQPAASQPHQIYPHAQSQPYSQPSRLPPLSYSPRLATSSSAVQQPQVNTSALLPSSQQAPRSSSTPQSGTLSAQPKSKESKSASLTGQSSDIPAFICPKGGSLPDLVAQVRASLQPSTLLLYHLPSWPCSLTCICYYL